MPDDIMSQMIMESEAARARAEDVCAKLKAKVESCEKERDGLKSQLEQERIRCAEIEGRLDSELQRKSSK